MFRLKQIYCFVLIFSLVILSGCGKTLRYEPKELRDLTVVTASHCVSHDDVAVLVKLFTDQDNAYYFNKPRLKYVPIQVTINNRSAHDWVLTQEFVNMPLVPMDRVHKDMSPSFMRVLGMSMFAGDTLTSMYNLRQLDAKNRISQDLAVKTLEQPLTIAAGTKSSVILFVNKSEIKRRLIMKLGHADIPGKTIDFELLLA